MVFCCVNSWTFVALWLIGLPLGLYLTFVSRPTYGLEGMWIGQIVGMTLLSIILFLQVLLLDWEKEARKVEYRQRRSRRGIGSGASGAGADASGGSSRMIVDTENPMALRDTDSTIRTSNGGGGNGKANSRVTGKISNMEYAYSAAVPVIGSRAVGGLPIEELFRTADEDLEEFAFIEFGDDADREETKSVESV
jgi:hypothetical protein